ncbi:hypothetical protein [Pelomonas sp. SE-A7]|uniref:hypothetical protein n=1 Tax=Pelomonas sp. SE-A7 TaxID=3054953 RepID=UPI00259CD98D|nr:hypothetical protein [Pelomonas sp. SE-A7]MDM4766102.1 hypothetical protein [Pelomonas sp. SE-A7]
MLLKRLACLLAASLIVIGGLLASQLGFQAEVREQMRHSLDQASEFYRSFAKQPPQMITVKRRDGSTYEIVDPMPQYRLREDIGRLRFGPYNSGLVRIIGPVDPSGELRPMGVEMVGLETTLKGVPDWTLRAELPVMATRPTTVQLLGFMLSYWPVSLPALAALAALLFLAVRPGPTGPAPALELPPQPQPAQALDAESLERLATLTRDNEQLTHQLLAQGEQLKALTDQVRARREAKHSQKPRTPA